MGKSRDHIEQSADVLLKYEGELLPSCACFTPEADGVVPVEGLNHVATALELGEGLMRTLHVEGVCATAAPQILAIALDAAMFHVAFSRLVGRSESPSGYTLISEMELCHDDLARLLALHRNRARRLMRESEGARH